PGTHPGEHLAKLLDIRLAGGIVDGRSPLRHDGRHDDIGRAGDGWLVQQKMTALQPRSFEMKKTFVRMIVKYHAQLFKADDMRVQSPPPDLVASGLGYIGLAVTRQHRAGHHHRSPQFSALAAKGIAAQVIDIDIVRLEY